MNSPLSKSNDRPDQPSCRTFRIDAKLERFDFTFLIVIFILFQSQLGMAGNKCEERYQKQFQIERQVLSKLATLISQYNDNSLSTNASFSARQFVESGFRETRNNVFAMDEKINSLLPKAFLRLSESLNMAPDVSKKSQERFLGYSENQRLKMDAVIRSVAEFDDGLIAIADLQIWFISHGRKQTNPSIFFKLSPNWSSPTGYEVRSMVALPNGNLAAIDVNGHLRWARRVDKGFEWDPDFSQIPGSTDPSKSARQKLAVLANSDLLVLRPNGAFDFTSIEIQRPNPNGEYTSIQVMNSQTGLKRGEQNTKPPGPTIKAMGMFHDFVSIKDGRFAIAFRDHFLIWRLDPVTGQYIISSSLEFKSSPIGLSTHSTLKIAQFSNGDFLVKAESGFYRVHEIVANKFNVQKLEVENSEQLSQHISKLHIFLNGPGELDAVGCMDQSGTLYLWKLNGPNHLVLAQAPMDTQKQWKEENATATLSWPSLSRRDDAEMRETFQLRNGELLTSTQGAHKFESILRTWSASISYGK